MTKRFDSDDTTAPFADVPKAAETRTVEKWGEAKGIWPQVLPSPQRTIPPGAAGGGGTVAIAMASLTGPRHNPEYGRFAAAKVSLHWPEGKEMTEAEFDAAIATANGHVGR